MQQASVSTKDTPPLPRGPPTGCRADGDFLSLREAILRGMDGKVVVPVPCGHKRPQLRLLHLHSQPCASELPEMGSGCTSNRQQRTLPGKEVSTMQGMGGARGQGREGCPHRACGPQGRARALEQRARARLAPGRRLPGGPCGLGPRSVPGLGGAGGPTARLPGGTARLPLHPGPGPG